MAGEKTAHRPPSRLAPSPPSKIKAPWRFFTRPGKNPSLSEIPYQSPKKCLKTQITTFSILKFSPKAKNTPVLTVFTLFLPFCHHPVVCSIVFLLLLSSHCHYYHPAAFAFLKISQDKIYQTLSCICPVNWHFGVPRGAVRFWDFRKCRTQSPTKTICSEVFFWVCFGFLRFSFAITVLGCFVPHSRSIISLYDFTYLARFFVFYDFVYFSLISSFIFSFVSANMISYSYCIRLRICYLSTYISSCSQVFLGSGMGNERLANVA